MGREITQVHYKKKDYQRFQKALQAETELVQQLCREGKFASTQPGTIGLELEVWLVDNQERPAFVSEQLLNLLQDPNVTYELGKFQLEYNSPVFELQANVFSRMQHDLQAFWDRVNRIAYSNLDAQLLANGSLPTLQQHDLSLQNMSKLNRYRALNEQLLHLRHGVPVHLNIQGRSDVNHSVLDMDHRNVMLEACCSSFQLHWQVPYQSSGRFFNAALVATPLIVAVTANSPYLFGKDLWQETRIPIFEQACEFESCFESRRVWLGNGFVKETMVECFQENLEHVPVMPLELGTNVEELSHLMLHNGTLWRWHRPLVGIDKEGAPHVRMEHRTMPSGPTIVDCIANAAFYYGLVDSLASMPDPPERNVDFATVQDNFYKAAQDGLEAKIQWFGRQVQIQQLILENILLLARQGLERLEIAKGDIDFYLSIIERRVQTGQTGAVWQRRWIQKYGHDMQDMTAAYHTHQASGRPVSEWEI